jgi:hypothetical protein
MVMIITNIIVNKNELNYCYLSGCSEAMRCVTDQPEYGSFHPASVGMLCALK